MNSHLFFSIVLACSTSFAYGFHVAIISSATLYLPFSFPILDDDALALALLVSIPLMGALIGSFLLSWSSEKFGRRSAILQIHLMYIVASLMQGTATVLWPLYFARFLLGIGIGGATSIIPVYVSELSPSAIRGRLGTVVQFCISSGIFMSYLVGYALSFISKNQWRLMLAIPGSLSIVYCLLSGFVLESPRWLMHKGRVGEAETVRTMCQCEPFPLGDRYLNAHFAWKDLFKHCKKELFIALMVNIFQQFSGFNILVYYAGIIFREMGFTIRQSLIASALSSLPQLFFLLVAAYCLDKFGRKPLLIFSCLSLMTCFIFIALLPLMKVRNEIKISAVIFARVSFSLGLGPIPAILSSEILPNEVREKGMALASFVNWMSNIIVTLTFLDLSKWLEQVLSGNIKYQFLLHSFILFVSVIFTAFIIPETRGVSLKSIDMIDDEPLLEQDQGNSESSVILML